MSTGTGSTGWLYSGRQVTASQLGEIQQIMGSSCDEAINSQLAYEISDETVFAVDDNRMYFFVREGFSNTRLSEGFVEKIKVTSEMLNGEVIVDGWLKFDLSIGDSFEMEIAADYALTGIKIKQL